MVIAQNPKVVYDWLASSFILCFIRVIVNGMLLTTQLQWEGLQQGSAW